MRSAGKITATLIMAIVMIFPIACSPSASTTTPAASPTSTTPVASTPASTTPATTTTPSTQATPAPVVSANQGIVEIRATDPGPAAVKSAVVYLSNLEIHEATGDNATDTSANASGWKTILAGPVSFDLMKVVGVEVVLGSANFSPGIYTQIRMDVTKVTGVTTGDVAYSADVPSDKLRVVGAFSVEAGKKTTLTLDFDGSKSLVATGDGKFIFKPVVQLLTGVQKLK